MIGLAVQILNADQGRSWRGDVGGVTPPIHHRFGKCLLDSENCFRIYREIVFVVSEIFKWLGIKSNSYSI